MAMISRKGRYIARPASWGIRSEEGKCPRFAIVFQALLVQEGGEWVAVQGDESITGFFTLVDKNGTPNEVNCRSFKDALGWDGSSFSALENTDWSQQEVQIVVDTHEYNGKTTLEVRYLNPRDYVGGVQKADPQIVQSLDQKYGATLRAMFGTKSTPKAASGSTNGASTKVASAPPSGVDAEKAKTWQLFTQRTPSYPASKRGDVFKKILKEAIPTKEAREFTADDWASLYQQIDADFNEATESLVPF